ncbi:MAG TPA: Ig-like domain-containing protein [Bacteroidales bacterium]|nr:Ig-like domain-containing protein [Bacteroidales bacterium]
MKKHKTLFFLLLLILISGWTQAQTIAMRIPDTTVVAGNTIDIPVYADNTLTGQNIMSYMLQITFNSEYFQPVGVIYTSTLSEPFGTPAINTSVPGTVTIASAGTSPLTGSGVFIYIRFLALQSGGTNVGFTGPAGNYFNEGIPGMSFDDGYVNISVLPTITVNPDNSILAKGEQLQFSVNDGTPPYQWSVTNSAVATVDATGFLTATQAGYTRVIAEDNNGLRDTTNNIEIRAIRLSIPDNLSQWQGADIDIPVNVTNLTGLNIMSGNFAFTYNQDILTPIGISQVGTLLASYPAPVFNSSIPGYFSLAFAGTAPLAGSGTLVYVKFHVSTQSTSTSDLTFTAAMFGETLLPAFTNGFFSPMILPSLTIQPNAGYLVAGETQQFTVNGGGTPPFTWAVSDTNVVSINQSGLMTAHRSGTVHVSVVDFLGATAISGAFQIYDTRIITPDTMVCLEASTFYYPLRIGSLPAGESVQSIEAILDYDTTYFSFVDFSTIGLPTQGWTSARNLSPGRVVFAVSGSSPFAASGTFLYVIFTVKPAFMVGNNTNLNLHNVLLNEGVPLPYTEGWATITGMPRPSTPVVGTIVQPTCTQATGSVDLSGLPPDNWVINPGNISGSGTNATIYLTEGTYYLTATNSSGCPSQATSGVVINPQPIPAAPLIGTITHPTCTVSTGSVVLNGLPGGNWVINPGNITGSGTGATITSLVAGTYNFTVTNTSGCASAPSANAVINAQPVTPAAPNVGTITHPTCTVSTGNVVLNGLPTGNWIINPGNISGSGISTIISGLTAGTHTFTVTNASGCTSPASANVVINAQPVTPTAPGVGTITHPTCTVSTGSVVLNGLPTGNWIINPGSISGSGTSTAISGLMAGTHNFTVTNASGCTSPASANVVVNAQPVTPTAPTVGTITHPTCTVSTGSVVLNGLPSGNWTINPGNISSSGSSTTISGLVAGTYNFTVTNASGCTSPASANVVVNAQPVTPTAPTAGTITHPTCTSATGSVVLGGLPAGSWTINPGNITGTGTSTTVANLVAGTYNFTVNNGSCTSPASASVVINTQPATPLAPTVGTITQPTCDVQSGSVVLSGLPAGSWIINPGNINGSGNSTTVSGLAPGTYNFNVTNASGCVSSALANVIINADMMVFADAGPTSTYYYGSPIVIGNAANGPGTISWSPSAGLNNAAIAQPEASPTVHTTYTITVNNNGCVKTDTVTVYFGGFGHKIYGKTRYLAKAFQGTPAPNLPTYSSVKYDIGKVIVVLKSYPAGAELARDTSNTTGDYEFNDIVDGTYKISYDKYTADTMQTGNEINAVDIAMLKYFIGHDTLFDPSRNFTMKHKKAINIDNNASINAVDVGRLKAKIGQPYLPVANFPKGNWVAFDTLVTVAGVNLNVTLKTICYGDYDASSTKYRDSTLTWSMAKSEPDNNIIQFSGETLNINGPGYFEVPLKASVKMYEFSALGLELNYPHDKFKLISASMPKARVKEGEIKINPTFQEIISDNKDLLVTDLDGVIRVVYATTNYFDVSVDEEILRLGFLLLDKSERGEIDLTMNGTGVIADQYGKEYDGAFLTMPRVFMQGDNTEAAFALSGYPNPFHSEASLIYTLPENGTVKINMYNAIGELVKEIADGKELSGKHILEIPAAQLPHGLYTFKMEFSGSDSGNSSCEMLKMVH